MENKIILERKFNLKLIKLVFPYILIFHLKKKKENKWEETFGR